MKVIANVFSLDFDFFKAISNNSETFNEYKNDLTPSYKACYVSYYKVWKLIALQKYESALILEENVDIEMSISSIVFKVYCGLPGNWEMLLKELVDPKDLIDVELVYRIKVRNITSYSLEPSAIIQ
ncbi:11410_t:CDS:2 [Funneliformis caledonium]|uniref:11410_t:CDS:1 n=1 Tax=Funneliformis caledonium TaxID=1117310 RepID=A0A9N9HZB2_9GLOM|nr:11410_t:CDS:2 [Funneliformis caledonium]